MKFTSKSFTPLALSTALILLFAAGAAAQQPAPEPSSSVPLRAVQYDVNRLAPDAMTSGAEFTIDDCDAVAVEVIASAAGVAVSIEGPAGQLLNANTVAAHGGKYAAYRAGEGEHGSLTPAATEGYHHLFVFPTLGAGKYKVTYAAPPGLDEDVAIITEVNTDSRVGSTVPVKIQLVDANGVNLSSAALVAHALGTAMASSYAPGEVEDAGSANPDDNFRFADFDGDPGYIFNLKTTGLVTGTYVLVFRAGADPATHGAQFQVK